MGYPRGGLDHDGSDAVNALVTTVPLPRSRTFTVVAITFAAGVAGAHVAPSVDDNNRYLKVTPQGDRIRLAYTVFFGEVPGASERRTIDTNHDGTIDEPEARVFGTGLAARIAAAMEVEVDGKVQPVKWDVIDLGMGTPTVEAGSFSLDLVAYPCFAVARGHHKILVKDRFRVPHPGETEVKVEDSPGITIDRARVGAADDPSYDYRFAGPGGPLSDEGLEIELTAGPKSAVTPDETCSAKPPAAGARISIRTLLSIVASVVAAGVLVLFVLRRRSRNTAAR